MSDLLDPATQPAAYDVTARKVHQWAMVALVAVSLVLGPPVAAVLLALAGLVMLAGRFWWPADIFRQLTWRVLEPAGLLPRHEAVEDHETRRVARIVGGGVWFVSAALVLTPLAVVGWILAVAIAVMVALDAAVSFCALCFISAHLRPAGAK